MSTAPYEDLSSPDRLHYDPSHNDQARIIDSLVESHAQPPERKEMPFDPVTPKIKPKPADRLLTGTQTINLGDPPFQIAPMSALRKHMRLTCRSNTATDFIRIADDPGKLQMISAAGTIVVGIESVDLPDYTGPIWISLSEGTGPVTVTWIIIAEGVDK